MFSASFQTSCLTARPYLNTQKYGLFLQSMIISKLTLWRMIWLANNNCFFLQMATWAGVLLFTPQKYSLCSQGNRLQVAAMEIMLNNVVLLFSATNEETPYKEFWNCCIQPHAYVRYYARKIFIRVYKFEHMGPTHDRGRQKILSRRGGEALMFLMFTAGLGRLGENRLKNLQTKKTLKNSFIFTSRYKATQSEQKLRLHPPAS